MRNISINDIRGRRGFEAIDTHIDDTVIAIIGNHGEEFGRYGSFREALLYSSMTEVPIVVRAHKLKSGVVDDCFAQHVDIPPTLLAASDLEIPQRYAGTPLQRVDERDRSTPTFFSLENGHVGVQTDRWKLIQRDGVRRGYEIDATNSVPDDLHERLAEFERLAGDRPRRRRFGGTCS